MSALSGFAAAPPANAAPAKYALIIGNSNYQSGKSSLKNPANDAKLMAQSLQKLGFDIKQFTDLDKAGMVTAVQAFADQLPKGATSVVFYSGHGMQIGGASYLLPVDMALTNESSVALRAYPVEKVAGAGFCVQVVCEYRHSGCLPRQPVSADTCRALPQLS